MTEPRGRKRRTREPDFVIDPREPNATIELETADLLNLQQSGLVQGQPNTTPEPAEREEVREGQALEPNVLVDLAPDPAAQTVFVDLGPEVAEAPVAVTPVTAAVATPAITRPGTPLDVQRVTPTMPRMRRASTAGRMPRASSQTPVARARGGMGLVVLVYVLATAALATSIYFRFVA